VLVIALSGVWFVQHGVNFLELSVQQVLRALISTGKMIAGALGAKGFPGLAVFVGGNFVLTCTVFLSTIFYSLLKGKSRPVRIVIASSTLVAGLSLMVIQAGFCMGFPPNVIGEGLKDVTKILFGIEGLVISFIPLYYSHQSRIKQPLVVPGEDVD